VIHEAFPYLCVHDCARAIAWYVEAMGAVEKFRLTEPSGRIGHAELQIGPLALMLSEAFPEYGLLAPDGQAVLGASIHLNVDHCDTWVTRLAAMPPTDQFYGERSARVCDPFGHRWLIGHPIEDVTPAEMQRRYTALMNGA
jgi:uncharacterized glyoxalase superfamily protein PhnB